MNFILLVAKSMLVMSLVFALSACSKERLYSDMSEQEANEIVAALEVESIAATKKNSKEGRWNIEVGKDDFARAMAILRNQNLPVQPFDGLGRVFKKEGMLATATEERARMMHAVSQEITRTIQQIDGVLVARVHIALPAQDTFTSKIRPTSASVLVKHRQGVELASTIPSIKAIVANGVEGLSAESVSVALFPTEVRAAPTDAMAPSFSMGKNSWLQLAVVLGLLSLGLGVVALRWQSFSQLSADWSRRYLPASKTVATPGEATKQAPHG